MVILENIDIDMAILQNINIDKISNRFKFGISNRATVVRTLARPRQGFRRRMILWSILTFLVHNLNYKGNLYLFTRKKFGWNEQDFSMYDSIDTIHGFTRALLVTPFLSKVHHMDDRFRHEDFRCYLCTIQWLGFWEL